MVLPDTDVLLQEQDIVELCLLHPGPVREVHHVRAVEDDQAQQHHLSGVLRRQ